ncbi:MAG: Hsp20/alpha crystallin family protein [Acidobacteria bacterium]|nr:Hsp20/alpha crystallin family protein [Acidobacteriota bacterium]
MRDLDWRVIRELAALRTRFREVLEQALLPLPAATLSGSSAFEPTADVWEVDDRVVVALELPGVSSECIEIRLEGESLVVGGEIPPTSEGEGRFLRIERPRGRFHRVIPLPPGVKGEPSAVLQAGVLEVTLPCSRSGRRRIPIEGGRR